MHPKLRALILLLNSLKYLLFCSLVQIIFRIFLRTMHLIKRGSSKSVQFLVTSLMCSGKGTCSSRYALQDEESFTTQEIYYKDDEGDHTSTSSKGHGTSPDDHDFDKSNDYGDGGDDDDSDGEIEIHFGDDERRRKYIGGLSEKSTSFRHRRNSHQGISDFRKVSLASAKQLDNNNVEQLPHHHYHHQQQQSCFHNHYQPHNTSSATIPLPTEVITGSERKM